MVVHHPQVEYKHDRRVRNKRHGRCVPYFGHDGHVYTPPVDDA